jgi:Zn-dependent protease with chaperone function
MNFFEHQDRARRKTGGLVVLFVIAVIMILIAVNIGAIFIAALVERRADIDPVSVCLAATAATLLIIVGGSLYKTSMLAAGGGASVAEQMGGRPIDPSRDLKEQTLQNVVEEMSIASGVPVPRVYIMDHEDAINAFAAGFTPNDAVVAVTRGTLEKLNRDELQGVIGHEFSHILNGDMRLNLRLMGILHGILLIAMTGWIIMRTMMYAPGPSYRYRSSRSRDSKDQGGAILAIILSAIGLIIIGSVGVFFGRLIQAAVSRQREFLADASAVQFTRNPLGLAGALKKIGQFSSHIKDGHAMGAAHLFFGSISRLSWMGLLATHPPLRERIKAIDPAFNGQFELGEGATDVLDEVSPSQRGEMLASMLAGAASQARRPMNARQVVDRAGVVDQQHLTFAAGLLGAIPDPLSAAAREPFSARAVIFALLLNPEPEVRDKQLALVQKNVEPQCYQQLLQLSNSVGSMLEGARLPLLEVTLPALRKLSPQQAELFRAIVRAMIEIDGRVTLFEYALNRMVEKALASAETVTAKHVPISYFALGPVRNEALVVVSALASASSTETDRAFRAGAAHLDPDKPATLQPIRNLRAVDEALSKLSQCSPPVKQRLITAFAATVTADGEVNVAEAELLRAVAATLDVPLPPLLGAVEG